VRRTDNLTTFMCRLSRNLGASTSWNPLGLSRPVMGLIYLYLYRPDCTTSYCTALASYFTQLAHCQERLRRSPQFYGPKITQLQSEELSAYLTPALTLKNSAFPHQPTSPFLVILTTSLRRTDEWCWSL
jgi:hypothetical protein